MRKLTNAQIKKLQNLLEQSPKTIYCYEDLPQPQGRELLAMTDNELAYQQVNRYISDYNYQKILQFNQLRGIVDD